jgi:hypothetical protein
MQRDAAGEEQRELHRIDGAPALKGFDAKPSDAA